jgi:hypothetical protein
MRLIVDNNHTDCPINRGGIFPCPRCPHSKSTPVRNKFLNTTTWWYCGYPDILSLSMLSPEDIIKEK